MLVRAIHGGEVTYSVLFASSAGLCACSWPILENDELKDPGRRDAA